MMNLAARQTVEEFYREHPYPSRVVGDNLLYDLAALANLAFRPTSLVRARFLDVGCGTGHRLVGLAKSFPDASFVGLDLAKSSLEIAAKLARYHGVHNVEFIEADAESFASPKEEFDVVTCTGVLHHMRRPGDGLRNIYTVLRPNGVAVVWLYNTAGEFERLLQREIVQLLAGPYLAAGGNGEGLLRLLRLTLDPAQYGVPADGGSGAPDQLAIDADAFLNPLVKSYRFDEVASICESVGFAHALCAGMNRKGESRLLDLSQSTGADHCLTARTLLGDSLLFPAFLQLSYQDRVRVAEAVWRPTGFTTVALKSDEARFRLRLRW